MSVHCMAIDDEVGVGGHNGDVFEYCVSKKSYSFLFGQNFFLGHTVSILAIRVAAPGWDSLDPVARKTGSATCAVFCDFFASSTQYGYTYAQGTD